MAEQLKDKFLNNYEENILNGVYEESDIIKVREDPRFVELYLKHNKGDVDKAVKFMHTSLEWRKSFGVKDLTSSSFPASFLSLNVIFFCNKDKNGHRILHIQFSKIKNDSAYLENARKYLVWQMEKAFQTNMGQRIVVLMDMSGASGYNFDKRFVKFLISCFTTYFPYMLEYMLVVELPWILNAFWAVVKAWLTAEQQKFVNVVKKDSLTKFISKDQLFTHLGGTSEVPTFHSETSSQPFESSTEEDLATPSPQFDRRFFTPPNLIHQISEDGSVCSMPIPESPNVEEPKPTINLVALNPSECITFDPRNQAGDSISSVLTINNPTSCPVAFKIKTTSPDLFRVRPVKGVVLPHNNQRISVSLSQGKQCNTFKDKFLVMLMMARDNSDKEDGSIWKAIPKNPEDFVEHKLSCKILAMQHAEDLVSNGILPVNKVQHTASNEEVMEQLYQINRNQMVITILLVAIIIKIFLCPYWHL